MPDEDVVIAAIVPILVAALEMRAIQRSRESGRGRRWPRRDAPLSPRSTREYTPIGWKSAAVLLGRPRAVLTLRCKHGDAAASIDPPGGTAKRAAGSASHRDV